MSAKSADIGGANPHKVLAFYDAHLHPFLSVLSRLIDYATHHHTLLYVLLFPFLLMLSSIFGGFAVWTAMAAITMHHYIQATAHKKRQLFEAMTAQAQEINAADLEDTRVWVNDILNLWWRTRAADLLQAGVSTLEKKLNANLPAFLMGVRISSFQVGSKPPRVDKVLRLEDNLQQNRMELDVSASYGGQMECTLIAILSENLKIQLRLGNVFIKTKIKLEVQFASHSTTLAFATIGDPALDFGLFPMNTALDLTNIPGLFDWIQYVALDQASRHLRWPNKITILNTPYQPEGAQQSAAPPRRTHSDNDFTVIGHQESPHGSQNSTPRNSLPVTQHNRSGSIVSSFSAGHTRQGSGSSASVTTTVSSGSVSAVSHTRQSSTGSAAPTPLVMTKNPSNSATPATIVRTNRTGQAENVTTKDQALGLFGITPAVKEYIENLCTNEDIFLQFPMSDFPPQGFILSKRQHKHALRMVTEVPQLGALRFRLCPGKLDDDRFWYVYFSLLRNRMPLLFVDEDERAVEYDWELLEKLTKKEKADRASQAIDLQWIP